MPQLISHRDGFGWQTPNVSDMLDPTRKFEDQTGELRNTATLVVRKFAELGTPVRLRSLEAYASHTRYHLLPDKVGAKGNERTVTQADLQSVLHNLLPDLKAQAAQLVRLKDDDPAVTLFLRTSDHKPLSLRPLLEQSTFIETTDYTTMAAGVNLNQEAVLLDLQRCNHLLIVGSSAARLHLQLGIALTLMLFNSPSYARVGLIGGDSTAFEHLVKSPHVLGNVVTSIGGLRRLLDGLTKHIHQRKALLEKHNAESVEAFNKQALSKRDLNPLPRIVLLLDSVSIPNWRTNQANWLLPLQTILNRGHEAGIHVVMTTTAIDPQNIPDRIKRAFTHQVVMRSALEGDVKMPATVPMEFIDAVLRHDGTMTPLELAAVQDAEMTRVVTYWQNMRTRRNAELEGQGKPVTSGNTGLLTLRNDMMPPPPPITREHPAVPPPVPDAPPDNPMPFVSDQMIMNARALAAYLGWLSTGPLVDVLNLSIPEAEETLRILRAIEVLEAGEGPVWRFARLSEIPESREK